MYKGIVTGISMLLGPVYKNQNDKEVHCVVIVKQNKKQKNKTVLPVLLFDVALKGEGRE